jgi:asparagine synthase (glutamine-hydrolysing)
MCGIAAIFAYHEGAPPADIDSLTRMHDALAMRGPDGEGIWHSKDRKLAMAHRRLSIIDLSAAAAQPMVSADGAYRIVYNGEIYNYPELRRELIADGAIFVTNSDTEVLLHLYARRGPSMVNALRGMFAFAIWDDRRKGMFLARDAYGIKPLYFADDGKTIRIASQVKALLAGGGVDTSENAAGHAGYFLFGYVPEPHTLFRGIEALPSGGSLWIDASGRGTPHRWFNLTKEFAEVEPTRFNAERLHEALKDSVRHHLVSDVPVGVFLSSGLDSATLVALASEIQDTSIRTITLGFEEFRGTPSDEAPLAEDIARHYGATHETRWITASDFTEHADDLFDAMDQPSIDGVNTYFVSKVTREAGLKVALSGLGGDELFAGYSSFREVPALVRALGIFRFLPGVGQAFRFMTSPLINRVAAPKYAGLFEYGARMGDAYLLRRGLFMPWELDQVLDPDMAREGLATLMPRDRLRQTTEGIKRPRAAVSALESAWYMQNQLLRDSDWASMAHSLEIRVPLVDVDLLRAIAPMIAGPSPPTKRDMALSPARALPDIVLNRPKTGFSVPVREWLGDTGKGPADYGYRGWARHIFDRVYRKGLAL